MHQVRTLFVALIAAAVASQTCTQVKDVDYEGYDIKETHRATASECCADCQATKGCKVYNWYSGVCYLKSEKGLTVPLKGAVSGVLGKKPDGPAQCSKIADKDYIGGDIAVTERGHHSECCKDCQDTEGCKLYNWADGVCYLKNNMTNEIWLPGSVSGVLIVPSPTDTPLTSKPTTKPTSAPKPSPSTPTPTTAPPAPPKRTPKPTAPVTSPPTEAPKTPKPPKTSKPSPSPSSPSDDRFYVHHDGYSLIFNCSGHTAERWNYTLTTNKKAAPRPSSFYTDPDVSKDCQQTSTKAYSQGYDRGHLVASSMMNDSAEQRKISHYMTNIAPQVATFNQGIWKTTESIESCYRNIERIYTWGGLVYSNPSNDYFLESHGIRTPDFWWKVVLTKDHATGEDKIISWYFPNQENLGPLDKYIVSVSYIESQLNDGLGDIPVPHSLKSFKASINWPLTQGCSARLL